jgi:hypothetical protein
MPQHPEAIVEGKKRPFTGAEFLESLRDGREVYIYGERVKDVTTHPAFRNAAASVAELYDALHDEKTKDVLTGPTDTGSGGYTHKFFKAARSREEVIAQRDAIAAWARITYGWLGRSPDYKAALLNTLGANAEFYGKFAGNARAPGTSGRRTPCSISTTRWSIRRSIATSRSTRSRTSTSPSRRRPTPASSSPVQKWWPPTPRSPTTTSSARTWARRSRIRAWW